MKGTLKQLDEMREDIYVLALFIDGEFMWDRMVHGTPNEILTWQDVNEGDRVLLSYETCYPYEIHEVAEVTVGGVSILADSDWMESMKGWE